MYSASEAGGNTVMALPIKLPAGVSFIYGTAGWEQLGCVTPSCGYRAE